MTSFPAIAAGQSAGNAGMRPATQTADATPEKGGGWSSQEDPIKAARPSLRFRSDEGQAL